MNRCEHNNSVGCNVKGSCNNCEIHKVYQQGRADTIDEILAFLKSKTWDAEEKAYIFNGSVLVPVNVLEDEIKQLKEKE